MKSVQEKIDTLMALQDYVQQHEAELGKPLDWFMDRLEAYNMFQRYLLSTDDADFLQFIQQGGLQFTQAQLDNLVLQWKQSSSS
jgi:hypothetical protein